MIYRQRIFKLVKIALNRRKTRILMSRTHRWIRWHRMFREWFHALSFQLEPQHMKWIDPLFFVIFLERLKKEESPPRVQILLCSLNK